MLEGTTYQVNDVYLFLKDNCKFDNLANSWKTYAGDGSIPGTEVLRWLGYLLPREVAEHYFRLMQTVCTGRVEFETSIDIDKIAIDITDALDCMDTDDLIRDYELHIVNGREVDIFGVDLDKKLVKDIVTEILKQHLNKNK